MTVRIQKILDVTLDDKKLAALLTPSLLTPMSDDEPQTNAQQGGRGGWVSFCDVHAENINAN